MTTAGLIPTLWKMGKQGCLYRGVLIGQPWTLKQLQGALNKRKKDPADRDRRPPLKCGSLCAPTATPIPCRLR
jgi:hypothetical protein